MQKHTKVYFRYFDYGEQDMIPCEICGARAVDIHYITGRGKGKDVIENLIALCREHHNVAHKINNKYTQAYLSEIHKRKLKS